MRQVFQVFVFFWCLLFAHALFLTLFDHCPLFWKLLPSTSAPVLQAVAILAGGVSYAGVLGGSAWGGFRPFFFRSLGLGCLRPVFSYFRVLLACLVWLVFWLPVCTRILNASLFPTSGWHLSDTQFSARRTGHKIDNWNFSPRAGFVTKMWLTTPT